VLLPPQKIPCRAIFRHLCRDDSDESPKPPWPVGFSGFSNRFFRNPSTSWNKQPRLHCARNVQALYISEYETVRLYDSDRKRYHSDFPSAIVREVFGSMPKHRPYVFKYDREVTVTGQRLRWLMTWSDRDAKVTHWPG
jgi:hypothetical protein